MSDGHDDHGHDAGGTPKGGDEKPTDPWHHENIPKTIEKRKTDSQNIQSVIDAMDGHFKHEVAKILGEGEDGTPKYEQLDSQSEHYNKDKAGRVKELVDEVYSVKNPIHPLRGVIDPEKLKGNYFYLALIDNIYSKHKRAIAQAIGKSRFGQRLKQIQNDNLTQIVEDMDRQATAVIDPESHANYWLEHLSTKYGLDKKKISSDLFKQNVQQLARAEYAGQLDARTVYDITNV